VACEYYIAQITDLSEEHKLLGPD